MGELLNWNKPDAKFEFPSLYKFDVIGDGSCLLHAICGACEISYNQEVFNSVYTSKQQFIRSLREELSKVLPLYYNTLSRGELAVLAKSIPSYNMEYMQKELKSSASLGQLYFEFLAEAMNINIFLLNEQKKDVIVVNKTDFDLYYKKRDCVILLFSGENGDYAGHYSYIGYEETPKVIRTKFSLEHPLIKTIKQRMFQIYNGTS